MSDLIQRITSDLQQKIDTYRPEYEVRDVGTVDEAGDGIARVSGLSKVRSQELVEFANGVMGIAFNLEENTVGVIILGEYSIRQRGHDRLYHRPDCFCSGWGWSDRSRGQCPGRADRWKRPDRLYATTGRSNGLRPA